jgi:hypothetical protein
MVNEPRSFWQGDTVSWSESFDEYPSTEGWVLSYFFSRADDSREVIAVGQPDGSHLVTITADESQLFLAGQYRWQARVASAPQNYTVGSAPIEVIPSLNAQVETRTSSQVTLDAISAVMEGKASRDQSKISVGGQSLDRMTWEDLLKAHQYFSNKVKRQRVAAGEDSAVTVGIF